MFQLSSQFLMHFLANSLKDSIFELDLLRKTCQKLMKLQMGFVAEYGLMNTIFILMGAQENYSVNTSLPHDFSNLTLS